MSRISQNNLVGISERIAREDLIPGGFYWRNKVDNTSDTNNTNNNSDCQESIGNEEKIDESLLAKIQQFSDNLKMCYQNPSHPAYKIPDYIDWDILNHFISHQKDEKVEGNKNVEKSIRYTEEFKDKIICDYFCGSDCDVQSRVSIDSKTFLIAHTHPKGCYDQPSGCPNNLVASHPNCDDKVNDFKASRNNKGKMFLLIGAGYLTFYTSGDTVAIYSVKSSKFKGKYFDWPNTYHPRCIVSYTIDKFTNEYKEQ